VSKGDNQDVMNQYGLNQDEYKYEDELKGSEISNSTRSNEDKILFRDWLENELSPKE